jgi:serine protease Do
MFSCLLPVRSGVASDGKPSKKDLAALTRLSSSFQYLVRQVSPAIVQVLTTGYASVEGDAAGLVASQRGTGSGVILDKDGYIVTNAHVVEGAQKIQVLLASKVDESDLSDPNPNHSGRTVPARIIGMDTETDLAVLKIEQKELPSLELADSFKLRKGQLVLAFGNPLGLENSVTMGVVSSAARQIRRTDPMTYIQTDAPINPGNSGGALVNTEGKIVGINTFILSQSGGSEGLGFAIPSNIVGNIFRQLKSDGHVHRAEIGAVAQTVTSTMAAGLRLPRDHGVILEDVTPGGPAEEAGLKVGDLVLAVDGRMVETSRRFDDAIYQRGIGDVVTLELQRGAERFTRPVKMVERSNDPSRFADMVTQESNLIPKLGLLALDLNEEIAEMLPPLRKPAGVVVAARVAGASSGEDQFLPGDLIDAVNTEPITSVVGLRAAIENFHSGDPVVFQIQRSGRLMFLSFEFP